MKYSAYVIFFLLFGLIPDLYICLLCLPGIELWWKLLICLPTLAALVSLVLIGAGVRYTPSLRLFSYLIFLLEKKCFFKKRNGK